MEPIKRKYFLVSCSTDYGDYQEVLGLMPEQERLLIYLDEHDLLDANLLLKEMTTIEV